MGEVTERLCVARKTAQGLLAKAKAAATTFSFWKQQTNQVKQVAEAREDAAAAAKGAEASK